MTTEVEFDYTAVLPEADADRPSSVIASLVLTRQPFRAVLWNVRHRAWTYAPGPAARLLYDDRQFDRLENIDRATAERIARDVLGTELPSEKALLRMCEEGETAASG